MFVNGKGKDKEKPELIPVGQNDAKDEIKPNGEILLELNDFAGFEVLKMKESEVLDPSI